MAMVAAQKVRPRRLPYTERDVRRHRRGVGEAPDAVSAKELA
jgi:hypothetical protein